jgi:hypothetical protein
MNIKEVLDTAEENKNKIYKAVSEMKATDNMKISLLKEIIRGLEGLIVAYESVNKITEGEQK